METSSSDPGANILALANRGEALDKSLTDFLNKWPTRRARFWELDAEIQPVKVMLMYLAESVNRFGNEVGFDESTVKPVLEVVGVAFERVGKALEGATEDGGGEHGNKVIENGESSKSKGPEDDGKSGVAKWGWVVSGDTLAEALGGSKGINRIARLLNIERGIIVSINRTVRYLAYRKLEKEYEIQPCIRRKSADSIPGRPLRLSKRRS